MGNIREAGEFCLGDVSAARRIRRRQPLLVLFYIIFATSFPGTGNRHDGATIRELLQMRACDKIPDTDTRARLIREVLIEKLWLEKQGGGVS